MQPQPNCTCSLVDLEWFMKKCLLTYHSRVSDPPRHHQSQSKLEAGRQQVSTFRRMTDSFEAMASWSNTKCSETKLMFFISLGSYVKNYTCQSLQSRGKTTGLWSEGKNKALSRLPTVWARMGRALWWRCSVLIHWMGHSHCWQFQCPIHFRTTNGNLL